MWDDFWSDDRSNPNIPISHASPSYPDTGIHGSNRK